jgi:hypothetical protein
MKKSYSIDNIETRVRNKIFADILDKKVKWIVTNYEEKSCERDIFHGQAIEIADKDESNQKFWAEIKKIIVSDIPKNILKKYPSKDLQSQCIAALKVSPVMEHIKLDRVYIGDVFSGNKITTIRKGIRKYKNSISIFITNDIEIPIRICSTYITEMRHLTKEDAIRDGFKSREKLIEALNNHYPHMQQDDDVTIVRFTVQN